jgi:8-oxo-dGTP diphosphatase
MPLFDMEFVLELVPHCSSVSRDGWAGDHDVRPLSEVGLQQAAALVAALGTDIDAVFSSPALRCHQTVEPLASAAGREITVVDALAEAEGFTEPREWVDGTYAPMAGAVGGAWSAGRMLQALRGMLDRHPGGRVVASSHGDVIPVLLATVCGAYEVAVPEPVERGGWYRLRFGAGAMTVTASRSGASGTRR